MMVSRRALLRLVTTSAAAAIGGVRFETPALAQPGAWLNATGPRVSFPKDAVIRTVLEDIAPDRMPLGSTQIHERLGGVFTPPRPLGPSEIPPGVYSPRAERDYIDEMVDELKMSRSEGLACLVDAA